MKQKMKNLRLYRKKGLLIATTKDPSSGYQFSRFCK